MIIIYKNSGSQSKDTQANNSYQRGRTIITNTRSQERIKLKGGSEEPMRAWQVASIIS
jgi:hypothetical protein